MEDRLEAAGAMDDLGQGPGAWSLVGGLRGPWSWRRRRWGGWDGKAPQCAGRRKLGD